MTQQQENILSKQIKGLTWGVVITITTVFGGGAVFIVKHLVRLEIAAIKSDGFDERIKTLDKRVDVVDGRVDNQEGRIFDLANLIKNK